MFKQLLYSCALVCYVCPDQYSQLLSKYLAVQIKIVQMTPLLLLLLIVSSGIKIFYFEVWSLFGIRASGVFLFRFKFIDSSETAREGSLEFYEDYFQ